MRQLAEETLVKDSKMYAALIDLEKAYDIVWREGLWKTLGKYGVSSRLQEAVKSQKKRGNGEGGGGTDRVLRYGRERGRDALCLNGCSMSFWTE